MPRTHLRRLLPGLKTFDMFGYVPQLNFQGQPTFTTYPGAVVSFIIYGLIIMNSIQLATAFVDGSKQNEKVNEETIDRFNIGPQYFSENRMEIALLSRKPIPEETGKIVAYQYEPCRNNDICVHDPLARLTSEVPMQKCTSKK